MDLTNNTPNETQRQDDFIMHPTNDVCFAGLMENPIVRKGFCAAVMRIRPDEIGETELLPTHLYRENIDEMFSGQLKHGDSYDKLQKCIHVSILDFIRFPEDDKCYRTIHFRDDATNELYNNKIELQFLELKKLPENVHSEEDIIDWMRFFNGKSKEGFRNMAQTNDIIDWMRFFNGKSREEFEQIAQTNEYLGEAYETLQRLSADDKKRLEYEAREKALKDYNTQMHSATERGVAIGEKNGIQLACKVINMHSQGLSNEDISSECNISVEKVQEILAL